MRFMMWTLVLAPALCTTAAFANDRASVDIPFSFESHGKVFPASQYNVEVNENTNMLVMVSKRYPSIRLSWQVIPVDKGPNDTALSIQFDKVGDMNELHVVRLGTHATTVLDARSSVPTKNRVPAQAQP